MAVETWLTFVVVCIALLATPGPIALFTISCTINVGKARALPVVGGAMAGDFIAMTASLLGIGALLASIPMASSIIRIAGSTVLIYLGILSVLNAKRTVTSNAVQKNSSPQSIFFGGLSLAVLHPSGFIFFTSFVPQFIDQDRPFFFQASMLVLSFLIIGGGITLMWLLIADRARILLKNQDIYRGLQYLSGGALTLFGLVSIIFLLE